MAWTSSLASRTRYLARGLLLASWAASFHVAASLPVSAKPSPAFAWQAPILTHQDSLFIIAATGEPRFKAQRDSSEKLLAADTSTAGYLIAHRLICQTPRQRHYVEHLFAVISDSGRHPAPVTKLASALPGAVDSVKSELLHIGSEMGDSAFLPVARLYLRADSEEVRKAAVRSLGMYPKDADVPWLLERIASTSALERQENLWALSRHGRIKEWPRLLPLLRDSNLYNRQLVRRLLDSAVAGDWNQMGKYLPAKPDADERLEWVLLALEMPGPASRAYVDRELPLLAPARRRFIESMLPAPATAAKSGR